MRRDSREVVTDRIAMTSSLRVWLCEQLLKVLDTLNRSSEEHIFAYPPASYSLPDYKLKVKHPMDLETMSRNARDVYCSVDEVELDMELMVKNCRTYNGEGALYDTYGQNLLRDSKVVFASIREEFAKQETLLPDQVDVLRKISKRHIDNHPLSAGRNRSPTPTSSTPTPRVGRRSATSSPVPAAAPRKSDTKRQILKQSQPTEPTTNSVKRSKPEPVKPVVATTNAINTPGQYKGCNFIPPGAMLDRLNHDERHLKNFSTSPSEDKIKAAMGISDNSKLWTVRAVINVFQKRIDQRDYYRLDEKKTITLVLKEIINDFNMSFTKTLLYPAERRAYENSCLVFDFGDSTFADRYPVVFLVRFLVLLPLHLQTVTDYQTTKSILRVSQELLFFINKNWSLFTGEGPKIEIEQKIKREEGTVDQNGG